MTASSPSAAARRSMSARSSPSWPARRGRCGISRMSATGGRAPIPTAIAPIIAVPTTAGTGSEVGRAGVITDETTHTKKVIFHPLMMPKIVIADPELTVGMPALHHRRHRHGRARPLPRGLLRAGLSSAGRRHRGRGHAAGVREPAEGLSPTATTSRRARHMMSAAAMGATAFQKGLGAIHCAVASGRRALRHASRHDQCGVHALRAGLQPRGDRGADRPARRLLRHRAASTASPRRSSSCARSSKVPHTLPGLIKVDMDKKRRA